jgi:putative ABC transport system permease protein
MSDLRYAIRTLLRAPGFTLTALLTLALGIGANTAIFSVVNAVLLRPLPFRDAGRLVQVWTTTAAETQSAHSAADYLDVYRENESFAALAGYRANLFSVASRPGEPLQLPGAYVTAEFFIALGVDAMAGRTFDRSDERSAERLVMVNEGSWRELFGGAFSAGRTLRVNGQPHVVAGVVPAGAEWPLLSRIWVLSARPVPPSPIELDAGVDPLADRDVRYFDAIARLKPAVALDAARLDMARLSTVLQERRSRISEPRSIRIGLLRDRIVGDVRFGLALMQGAVGLVLLIACANVSSLLLARATGRRRELAVRSALGAGRTRLLRLLLVESLALGAAGGGAGLLAGAWLTSMLQHLLPASLPRADEIGLDWTVALVTTALALAAGVLFGIMPAIQASGTSSAEALKQAGDRGGAARARARAVLVAGQIGLTLVLLVAAGLLLNSFLRLRAVDPGIDPENVTIVGLTVPQSRYPSAAAQINLYRRLVDRLETRAEIQAVGVGFPGPLRSSSAAGHFFIDGRPDAPDDRPFANLASISPGYLPAMGIPLLEGRLFTESDAADAPHVAIVSAAFARRYWPGESAIGRRLRFDNSEGAPWRAVVGVTGDVKQLGLDVAAPPIMFIPYTQFPLPFTNLAVRSTSPTATIGSLVRSHLAAIDPDLAAGEVTTLGAVLNESIAEPRFRTFLLAAFALTALLLAAVGLFGLISYSVAQRRREIGIRVALGAKPATLIRTVMREGLTLCAAGLAAGLLGSMLASRVLASFLFGVGAADPLTFGAVATLLVGVAALATYIPARRALSVDPVVALRAE